jgi:hypothetical protein
MTRWQIPLFELPRNLGRYKVKRGPFNFGWITSRRTAGSGLGDLPPETLYHGDKVVKAMELARAALARALAEKPVQTR